MDGVTPRGVVRTYGKRSRASASLDVPTPHMTVAPSPPLQTHTPLDSSVSGAALCGSRGLAAFLGRAPFETPTGGSCSGVGLSGGLLGAASSGHVSTGAPRASPGTIFSSASSWSSAQMHSSRQLHIDLGQRVFDSVRCKTCGMLYCPGDVGDERAHSRNCAGFSAVVGGAPVLWAASAGDIDVAITRDSFSSLKKAFGPISIVRGGFDDAVGSTARGAAVSARLAAELGSASAPKFHAGDGAPLLFVAIGGRQSTCVALGALVATRLPKGARARRVLATGGAGHLGSLPLALTVPRDAPEVTATLVVAQIWVAPAARRAGIACALLDAARESALHAYTVPRDQLAFSNPTADGYRLAAYYCGREDVPVTDGDHAEVHGVPVGPYEPPHDSA